MESAAYTDTESPDIADLTTRLHRFCRAIDALPSAGPGGGGGNATPLTRVDDLLQRVRAITALLNEPTSRWDPVDHAAARLLLTDLAGVAAELRALATSANRQFKDVADNGHEVRRSLEQLAVEFAEPLVPRVEPFPRTGS